MDIVVDVDLTVVDAISGPTGWINWMIKNGAILLDEYQDWATADYKLPYAALTMFIPESLEDIDAFAFWGQHGLYQSLEPIKGSVDVITRLVDEGHDVTFCSFCVRDHWESKRRFIHDYFPSECGLVMVDDPTKKTRFIGDVYIDDRAEYLKTVNGAKSVVKTSRFVFSEIKHEFDELDEWDYDALMSIIKPIPKLSQTDAILLLNTSYEQKANIPNYRTGQAIFNLLPDELATYAMTLPDHSDFFYNMEGKDAISHFFKNLVEA